MSITPCIPCLFLIQHQGKGCATACQRSRSEQFLQYFNCSFLFVRPKRTEQILKLILQRQNYYLRARRNQTNQRKRAPKMITSPFFGKMPLASRAQKRLKFALFSVCPRAALKGLNNSVANLKIEPVFVLRFFNCRWLYPTVAETTQ